MHMKNDLNEILSKYGLDISENEKINIFVNKSFDNQRIDFINCQNT